MTDVKMAQLEKIRGLLAKAEATQFPEEAKSFFEGAQRLMTRYSIEEAMVRNAKPTSSKPVVRKVPLVVPYIRAKGILLGVVARANGCTVIAPSKVRGKGEDVAYTLFGFEGNVGVVEGMFTSLLVQMTSELFDCEADIPRGVHGKTWKNNFLLGFATEIQTRLERAKDDVVTETGMGLVLVQDKDRVESFVEEYYGGRVGKSSYSVAYNGQARAAGQAAGSRANMGGGGVGTSVRGSIG